jgi:hypothetical protein
MRSKLIVLAVLSLGLLTACQKAIRTDKPTARVIEIVPGSPASNTAYADASVAARRAGQPGVVLREFEAPAESAPASRDHGNPDLAGAALGDIAVQQYLSQQPPVTGGAYPGATEPSATATEIRPMSEEPASPAAPANQPAASQTAATEPAATEGSNAAQTTGTAAARDDYASNMAYARPATAAERAMHTTGTFYPQGIYNYDATTGYGLTSVDQFGNAISIGSQPINPLYWPAGQLYTVRSRNGNVVVETYRPYALPGGITSFPSLVPPQNPVLPDERASDSMVYDRVYDDNATAADRAATGSTAASRTGFPAR